jgi:hypothetical protein
MGANRRIAKCITALLVLVFMLKAGGGLYLHNWLHAQNKEHTSLSSDILAVGQSTVACTCIDDFYIPFIAAPEQIIQAPERTKTEFVASLISLIPASSKSFHLLRGPPLNA